VTTSLKLDENLSIQLAEPLIRRGHDVSSVHAQGLKGSADPRIAEVCRSERRALVTLDLDFSDISTYRPSLFAGLIVLRPHQPSVVQTAALIDRLALALDRFDPDGQLWIVSPKGLRIRED
jgi:predicted nuclease of predicted toxin-antitoxin system